MAASSASPYARTAVWLFLSFSMFYVAITRGHFVGTDEIAVYQTARSLWEEGNLSTGIIVNTFPGRNGRYYSQYNVGLSIVALPLYGFGKTIERKLHSLNSGDWIATFAGPSIGNEPSRWGGEIEIFFVNLFNCFTTALLCTLFFSFSLRLGASPRWALISTALLGLTTLVGPFSTGFLQHSSEALFLLWAFYFLFSNAQCPEWRLCFWAGFMVGLMILFRLPSLVALPGLGLYLIFSLWQRPPEGLAFPGFIRHAFSNLLSFVIPIAAGLILCFVANYIKFETVLGKYNNEGFHTPLLKGLYAFLFSPGASIFLFSPLLVLAPWSYRHFFRQYRMEAIAFFLLAGTYLIFYGTYTSWHGLWSSLGPRYLVPIVPILLLPIGRWMEHIGRKVWVVVAPLAAIGLWIQLVHVAVNFAFVYHYEKYPDYRPPYSFLFIPDVSPIVAHSKALLAADFRVDMWLINVYRNFGPGRLIILLIPLVALLLLCVWKLWRSLRPAEAARAQGIEPRFSFSRGYVISFLVLLTIVIIVPVAIDYQKPAVPKTSARQEVSEGISEEEKMMKAGLDALYNHQDYDGAAAQFRKVLERNPNHYGANFQLAMALDRAGKKAEAHVLWVKVLKMAETYNDKGTVDIARKQLQMNP